MKLQFSRNQQFQLDAIQSIVDLFEGQPLNKSDFEISFTDNNSGGLALSEKGIGNRLMLKPEQLLSNLQTVQQRNQLRGNEVSTQLLNMRYLENTEPHGSDFPNFSVEMETGTGKTYVYIRTIYELHKVYGFKKFIIVVPTIAIREGVVKSLEITHAHMQEIYDNTPCSYDVYDSQQIVQLANFARSSAIQILVMNIDSFTKDANIINQRRESGIRPIEYLQGVNPIVIMDEPQNMETDIRKKAIINLNPLFTLRYSATHRDMYNLVYSLDPVRAYDLGLVKQIEVDSVVTRNDNSGAFVSVDGFKVQKKTVQVKLTLLFTAANGITKKQVTAKNGDDLYILSNHTAAYKSGYVLNEIDSQEAFVTFSSGLTVYKGASQGGLNDVVMKEMIKTTIENHFRKKLQLEPAGIKVLSLFFIDRVANYRGYTENNQPVPGKFAVWFEELYNEIAARPRYRHLNPPPVEQVHNGYFSQDKGRFKDSKEGKSTKTDDAAYKLIMQRKEQLLDINEPLQFIFSHSALREGWDNPNVFQICSLNESHSDMKKRQELGRGMRLCVDSSGARVFERVTNRLTVIANESFETFAKALQNEIETDCGVTFTGRIKNARKRVNVELKKNYHLDENFLTLWNKISQKTEYRVNYQTDDLIRSAAAEVKKMPAIPRPQIQKLKTSLGFAKDENNMVREVEGEITGSSITTIDIAYEIPDFLGFIQSKTELTRATIAQILTESGRLPELFHNPQMFMDAIVKIIRHEFDMLKVNGIKYEKIAGQVYAMSLFESKEIEEYLENVVPVIKQQKTLYNYVTIDSLSTPEIQFAKDCDSDANVLFYIKLPDWFKIKTPIGAYTPDWALIKREENDEKKIYFVAETKDARAVYDRNLLRVTEQLKIQCGEQHFKSLDDVHFKVTAKVADLAV